MLRHALSLLLVASITSCPFVCNLNGALAKVAGGTPHTCCDCCHDEHPAKSECPDGSDHSPLKPGKCCQCICGGAISDMGSAPLGCLGLERMGVSANGCGTGLFGDSRSQSSLGC